MAYLAPVVEDVVFTALMAYLEPVVEDVVFTALMAYLEPVVEDVVFTALMAYLEPDKKMPCRKTLTARVEKLYDDGSASTNSQTPYVVLTTDCWQPVNTLSYISVTSHYTE